MLSSGGRDALLIGTILQLAMVLIGHIAPAVAGLFGPIGVLISLLAGLIYALRSGKGAWGGRLLGGAVVGGLCALVGIAVSCALGDVDALILVLGTASSAVTGAIGAAIGRALAR
jgi:hypothetical protein